MVYTGVEKNMRRLGKRFYIRALIGGAVVGIIGIISVYLYGKPYPLGISYDIINLALTPNTLANTLLVLFVLKLLATSFTLGSTGVGGIFIPQIVMGAMVGGAFGEPCSRLDLIYLSQSAWLRS